MENPSACSGAVVFNVKMIGVAVKSSPAIGFAVVPGLKTSTPLVKFPSMYRFGVAVG